jgi:hypothetical protein
MRSEATGRDVAAKVASAKPLSIVAALKLLLGVDDDRQNALRIAAYRPRRGQQTDRSQESQLIFRRSIDVLHDYWVSVLVLGILAVGAVGVALASSGGRTTTTPPPVDYQAQNRAADRASERLLAGALSEDRSAAAATDRLNRMQHAEYQRLARADALNHSKPARTTTTGVDHTATVHTVTTPLNPPQDPLANCGDRGTCPLTNDRARKAVEAIASKVAAGKRWGISSCTRQDVDAVACDYFVRLSGATCTATLEVIQPTYQRELLYQDLAPMACAP